MNLACASHPSFTTSPFCVFVFFVIFVVYFGLAAADEQPAINQDGALMKKLVLIVAVACASCAPQAAPDKNVAAWERRAQNITLVRDNWGIAHISGKTDADAVFGAMYAQAEDDFNRVETNYINGMGRLAEAEGEGEIYRDLRMKIFIDPDDMKAQYQKASDWLKRRMDAYADGLNYYLYKTPT